MKNFTLALLFSLFGATAFAQTPKFIRLTKGDADLTTAKARLEFMRKQMVIFSNEGEKDRGTYKFLSDAGYFSHLYVSRVVGTNDCFVFYYNPERQATAEVQQDLLVLKKFVYDGASTFDITVLQGEPMQMN